MTLPTSMTPVASRSVVDMQGRRTHELVEKGITALVHLEHRGAAPGAEVNTGDGAGILIQVPYALLPGRASTSISRPPAPYATGIAFLPADATPTRTAAVESIDKIVASEDLVVLGLA